MINVNDSFSRNHPSIVLLPVIVLSSQSQRLFISGDPDDEDDVVIF